MDHAYLLALIAAFMYPLLYIQPKVIMNALTDNIATLRVTY